MADTDREVEGSDLAAIIAGEIRQAQQYDQAELAAKRALALNYMRGEMTDLPHRINGSSQTSRDVADTVAWILPGVVRVFTGSDQMVQYDKVREENDDWSRDASEYTNYSFFRENDGYRILYNATYDALVQGNGVACSYWDPPRISTRVFRNKLPMEFAALGEDGWQPTAEPKPGKPELDVAQDQLTGEWLEVEVPTYTVKMQRQDKPGKICDITCKPENLLLNSAATTIDGARFVAYLHDDRTRSDLLEMADDYGWDKEVIKELASGSPAEGQVSSARYGDVSRSRNSPVRSADPIELYECYIRADMDDDGIGELIQAWYAGGEVLGWEEWEEDIPYTDIPCYPVPHRWDADSVADRHADIQRVKTVLLRQALDNLYASNLPMREVELGSVLNPDMLVHPRFGGVIWKKPGSAPIQAHVIPFVADKAFAAMGYMDEMGTKRTGVSRQTMALDPEALQNQTATANQNQRDASYSQIELIARNMAELGWAKFFKKRLLLAIKYQQVRKIPSKREENGFREIDPAQWDPDMAVAINVGLGTGSRDRDMSMLNTILAGQIAMADRLGQGGYVSKALEFIPKIRNTAVKIAESSGLKNPEEFYPDISDEELAAWQEEAAMPKQNPAVELEKMKLEAAGQLEQMRAQTEMQVEQQKAASQGQAEELKARGNAVKEQAQLDADLQTKEADRRNALQVEHAKLRSALQVEELRIASAERIKLAERALEREKMVIAAELERDKMANSELLSQRAAEQRERQQKPNGNGVPE